MRFSKPPGVPCPPNNPHCQGLEPIGVSIQSDLFTFILIVAIFIYSFIIFRKYMLTPKYKITNQHKKPL